VRRLNEAQQYNRSMAANIVWFQLEAVSRDLENAQEAMANGDRAAAEDALRSVERSTQGAERSVAMLSMVVSEQQHRYAFGIETALNRYTSLARDIKGRLQQEPTILPADQALVTAMQADIRLMLTTYPEELLAAASYDTMAQALTQFCSQMQVMEVKKHIRGMDTASRAACGDPLLP
jgi:hypothetical protein